MVSNAKRWGTGTGKQCHAKTRKGERCKNKIRDWQWGPHCRPHMACPNIRESLAFLMLALACFDKYIEDGDLRMADAIDGSIQAMLRETEETQAIKRIVIEFWKHDRKSATSLMGLMAETMEA